VPGRNGDRAIPNHQTVVVPEDHGRRVRPGTDLVHPARVRAQRARAVQGQAVVRQGDFDRHACHPTTMSADGSVNTDPLTGAHPHLCAVAHGDAPAATQTRTLVTVFASPVAEYLIKYGNDLGYRTVLVEP